MLRPTFRTPVAALLALLGQQAVALSAVGHEAGSEGLARASLDGVGESVVESIRETTEALKYRSRHIARDDAIVALLETGDRDGLAAEARRAVVSSDLVDVVAFFGPDGSLLAFNDVDSRGEPFTAERLDALKQRRFGDRPVVMDCLECTDFVERLEFQQACDFTPALFDSVGLAVAFTVPIRRDGRTIGAVSTRLRFERLLASIDAPGFFEGDGRIWFVGDQGSVFDEQVLRGERPAPAPASDLVELLHAVDWSQTPSLGFRRGGRQLSIYDVGGLGAMEGGGIRVILDVAESWVDSLARADFDRRAALEAKTQLAVLAAVVLAIALAAVWRTRRELLRACERADRASQSKSSFLAATSHEIRTPMSAILGYAEILDGTGGYAPSPELQRESLAGIRTNARHLLTLVGDVLDLAKAEAGAIELDAQPSDPRAIVEDIRRLLACKAEERGIELHVEVAGDDPPMLLLDETRLRQILLNLVGNAIKFTPEGSVTLRLRGEGDTDEHRLTIEVVDTGIGIAPGSIEAIFDAYAQADASTTRRFGGTGLGLAISLQLAELMGGTLMCCSEVGAGSTFRLSLSAQPAPAGEGDAALPADDGATLEGLRVLVADDGPINRRLFALMLSGAGVEVSLAEDGGQALELWRADPEAHDLVLLDAQMPVADGAEVLHRLRAEGAERPIVVLTADAVSGAREHYLKLGFDDYATKPITREALLALVTRWGRRRREAAA